MNVGYVDEDEAVVCSACWPARFSSGARPAQLLDSDDKVDPAATTTPSKPRISKSDLDALVEEATVDACDETEQVSGIFTMLDENLEVPFKTEVFGVEVIVERVDLDRRGQIIAVCVRGRERQTIPILDLPLPTPPPEGSEWIDAYRHWLGEG